MANATEVEGTFSFDEDFYKKNSKIIERYFDNAYLAGDYGIDDVNSNGDGSFDFDAIGRWSMEDILEWCLSPQNRLAIDHDKSVIDMYKDLLSAMRKADATVTFDYTDYDSGNFYVKETDVIRARKEAKLTPNGCDFVKVSSNCEDLDMDDKTLIDNELEDGIIVDDKERYVQETIDEIVKELKEYIEDKTGQTISASHLRHDFIDYVDKSDTLNGGFQQMRIDNPVDWLQYDGRDFAKQYGVDA